MVIGKSTSLRNALSLFGAHVTQINGPDSTPAAVVGQATVTTVPVGMYLHELIIMII